MGLGASLPKMRNTGLPFCFSPPTPLHFPRPPPPTLTPVPVLILVPPQDINLVLSHVDVDKDGLVSYEEFVPVCFQASLPAGERPRGGGGVRCSKLHPNSPWA